MRQLVAAVVRRQPSVVSRQPSVVSRQPSVVSRQPSAVSCQLSPARSATQRSPLELAIVFTLPSQRAVGARRVVTVALPSPRASVLDGPSPSSWPSRGARKNNAAPARNARGEQRRIGAKKQRRTGAERARRTAPDRCEETTPHQRERAERMRGRTTPQGRGMHAEGHRSVARAAGRFGLGTTCRAARPRDGQDWRMKGCCVAAPNSPAPQQLRQFVFISTRRSRRPMNT
jgi:hypothetical protein